MFSIALKRLLYSKANNDVENIGLLVSLTGKRKIVPMQRHHTKACLLQVGWLTVIESPSLASEDNPPTLSIHPLEWALSASACYTLQFCIRFHVYFVFPWLSSMAFIRQRNSRLLLIVGIWIESKSAPGIPTLLQPTIAVRWFLDVTGSREEASRRDERLPV